MNFGPGGRAGSPVCGICLLCVQAMPLGCAMRCNGRLLLVEAGDRRATYDFALEFLSQNRQILSLIDGSGEEKIRYPQSTALRMARTMAEVDCVRLSRISRL